MIDQALAQVAIILEHVIESALLPDLAVMMADGVVICFGTARQRGQQIVADMPQIEFVQAAAAGRMEVCRQLAIFRQTSGVPSRLRSAVSRLDPARRARRRRQQQLLGRDEMLVDGVAQVRQVDAAEGAVPPRTIALGAIQFLPRLRQRAGINVRGVSGCAG